MKHRWRLLTATAVMAALSLVACRPSPDGVATLRTDGSPSAGASVGGEAEIPDNEALMIAFTACMREEGVEVLDPTVDAGGNVDKPELADGAAWDKGAQEAWEACEYHLEGFTWEEKGADAEELAYTVDLYVAFATCMREKGYDVADPTVETLETWEWKETIDWDDPDALSDYEECSGESFGSGGKK